MATAVLDDEHLEELARDHFTYEVHTCIAALVGLLKFQVAGKVSSPDGNIYLEAFVFHARALDDFLRSTGKRVDDLQATDKGKEPTARQVAEAAGASLYTARAALRRFRAGQVPARPVPPA